MKIQILILTGFLIFLLLPLGGNAQNRANKSFSIFSGGMVIKRSILSTTKLGHEFKNFGFITDFSYDDYYETWHDGSKSYFKLRAISLSARYYLRPKGRSLFAEVNAGLGFPKLTTSTNGDEKVKISNLPITGFGLGWRFGKKPKGLFGETGWRTTTSLKDLHLFTTNEKPATNDLENISYQSWIFKKGNFSSQIYLGIGYSF